MATYNKIFFQSGPTGNVPGWGKFVEEANRQGIPVAAAVSDTTSLLDDLKKYGHAYNVANRGNFIPTGYVEAKAMRKIDPTWKEAWGRYHLSVPLYNIFSSRDEAEETYQRSARLHLDAAETRIPAGLDRQMVSVSTWNEIRPYTGWGSMVEPTADDWQKQIPGYEGWADAIGRQAYWIGKELIRRKEAGESWFRWAAFGFAGGNPEPGMWKAAGMLDYLRLAGRHPDVLGLALHEYCFTFDIWRGFEQKDFIGRFEQLFAVCDKHKIPRPWVEIKEWGWKEDDIPTKSEAMKQLAEVAKYYARFPQIKLAALWTANGGWRDASQKVPGLAEDVYKFTLQTTFPDPPAQPTIIDVTEDDSGDDKRKTTDGAEEVETVEEKVVLRQVLTAVSDPIHTLQLIVKKRDGSGWKTERTITLPIDADTQIELHYIQQLAKPKSPGGTEQKESKEGAEESDDSRKLDTQQRLLGMDISESQSPRAIKYDKLQAEGIAYAFLRASRGSSVVNNDFWVADTTYEKHFAELGKVGILRGSYHVLYEWDPEGQAEKFFNIYQEGELPPVLDIEKGQYTGRLTAVIAQRFLKKWAKLGGEPPIIYTNQSTWNEMMGNPKWSANYKLWVASYDADGDNPYAMPKPWGKDDWSFWQYTKTGKLQAYDKGKSNIDLNWFRGGLETLRQLGSTTKKTDDKQPPPGKLIDLLEYMRGDGRIYEVRHPDGRTETFQTQHEGNKFYFVKNHQWEELWADDTHIWRGRDTSPGPAPDYAEKPGKVRYYHQFEPGKEGARWVKRYMAVGEQFIGSGHRVQFYYKADGKKSAANSGNHTNRVTLVAFHQSKTWGKNTIRDVIELKTGTGETMFFGKGWGLVAWGADWGQSAIMERLEGRTPNKRELIR